jgi:hypothetical protein
MNHCAWLMIATVMNWRILARFRSPSLNLGTPLRGLASRLDLVM